MWGGQQLYHGRGERGNAWPSSLWERLGKLFTPDENNSNRWQDVLEVTRRAWMKERFVLDDRLAPDATRCCG
jgi:hypothetical protein